MRKPSIEPQPSRTRVATHLRRLRLHLGLSQEALADRAALHRTYIGQVERGERNVTVETVDRIAAALGVDASELFSPLRPSASAPDPSVAQPGPLGPAEQMIYK